MQYIEPKINLQKSYLIKKEKTYITMISYDMY